MASRVESVGGVVANRARALSDRKKPDALDSPHERRLPARGRPGG